MNELKNNWECTVTEHIYQISRRHIYLHLYQTRSSTSTTSDFFDSMQKLRSSEFSSIDPQFETCRAVIRERFHIICVLQRYCSS
jgi:hypothetical protein